MNDYQILHNAPEGATHFDGKTYFRFEMFEHGQAYLVLKNGVWDRGLPAYPVYSCRCLQDIKRLMYQCEVIASLQGQLQNKLMPKVLPSNWISINEKLPEKNTYVLMAATSGYVGATFYTEPKTRKIDCKLSAWFEHANTYGYEVTHWMPLPKAPTQESE